MATRAILIIATVTGTLAGPLSSWGDDFLAPASTACAQTCPRSVKFSYEESKTYQYEYSSQIITTVGGAMDDFSSLNLAATVNLEVLSPCEMAIKLSDVSLQDIEPGVQSQPGHVEESLTFKRALQARPMRFSFLDGEIEAVCPDPADEVWVKNVKRAIISALQNRMPTLETNTKITENDISGSCDVDYELTNRGWRSTNIRKTKDPLSCSDRQHVESAFQGTPYRIPSNLQSLPLLKGTHVCNQAVNSNGVLQSSVCHESHIFRPFSKYDSGALTNVTSTLTLNGVRPGVRTEMDSVRRESLKYEHSHDEPADADGSRSRTGAQKALRQLCRASTDDIRPETPALFANLVREMKELDLDDMTALHQVVESGRLCDKAHKFFRDAIPMLGTATSVAFIRDFLNDRHVTGAEAELWLQSMAFISHPTVEMLRAAKPMLRMEPRQAKVALSVSSLVNTFCKLNPNCGDVVEVEQIIALFEEDLRYNCMINSEQHYETIMMAIKGIGNTGPGSRASDALNRCYMNTDAPLTIRIAAINAFRRSPCAASTPQLMRILRDEAQDSELRITAYLALMACPDANIISNIAEMLHTENVNQVGSFIWTHMTNLKETSHIFKKEIRDIVDNIYLEREFDLDKRKFSRNIEWSAFSEWMNTGAMLESNLIWSPESYIPRSAMVNVTVDMFGNSVNLMEIGGRLENFENIVERIFNPESNDVERERRSTSNDISVLDNEYRRDRQTEPEGSYYLRFFGNEIHYGSFRGLDFNTLFERVNYLQWLIDLSQEHNYDITKSFMFLDSTMVVPTIAGLPLKLNIEGSTVMETKINGHLDLTQLMSSPRSVSIRGTVQPSAAIEISGSMGVDAKVAKTGVKMTNTLHTSTLTTANIELQNGQIVTMNFDTPREKMELFTAQSKFYLIYRDEEREQSMLTEEQDTVERCVGGATLTKATGMELCGQLSYPRVFGQIGAPWPPMTGPMSAKVELWKRDPTMTGYNFLAKMIRGESVDTAVLSFDTPQSSTDREIRMEVHLDRNEKTLQASLRSPWKQAEFNGVADLMNPQVKRLNARAVIDGTHRYDLTSSIAVDGSGSSLRLEPNLEISWPQAQPIRMRGSINYKGLQRTRFDINIENIFSEPVVLSGNLNQQSGSRRDRYSAEFHCQSPMFVTNMESYVNLPSDGDSGSSRVEIDYRLGRSGRDERVVLSSKWRNEERGDRKNLGLLATISNTKYANLNGEMNVQLMKNGNNIRGSVEVGPDDERKKITINHQLTLDYEGPQKSLQGRAQIAWPYKGVNWAVETEQQFSLSRQSSSLAVENQGRSVFRYNVEHSLSTSPLRSRASAELQYQEHQYTVTEVLEERSNSQYHYELSVRKSGRNQLEVTGDYAMIPRHELSASLNVLDWSPATLTAFLKPELRDFQSRFEVGYANKVYLVEHLHQFRGDMQRYDMTCSVTLGCSPYLVEYRSELHKTGDRIRGEMETKWDAQRDQSKKVSVQAEVITSAETPSFSVRTAWWPQEFLELSGGAQYQEGSYYNPDFSLSSNITLRSSIRPIQELGAIYNVQSSARRTNVHTEATYAPSKTIVSDFNMQKQNGWSQIESTLDVQIPFGQIRQLRLNHEHNYQNNQLSLTQSHRWNSEEIAITFNGRADVRRNDYSVNLGLTTPFRQVSQMTIEAQHNVDGQRYTSSGTFSLNQQEYSASLNMNHGRNGYYITNNGDFTVITPLREYRMNKIAWNHRNTQDMFKCHHEVDFKNAKSVFDLTATKSTSSNTVLHLESYLTSPYIDDIRVEFDHTHSSFYAQRINLATSGRVEWGRRQEIAFNHEAQIQGTESVTESFVLTTPFAGYERIAFDATSRYNGNEWIATKEYSWAPRKTVRLNSRMTLNLPEFNANIELTTPHSSAQRIVLALSNQRESNLWVTSGNLEYSRNQNIVVTTKLGLESLKKLYVNIATPFSEMTSFVLDVEHQGSLQNFRSSASIECQPLFDQYRASAQLNANNPRNINGRVSVDTPLRNYDSLTLVFTHSEGSREATELTFEMPRSRFSLTRSGPWDNLELGLEMTCSEQTTRGDAQFRMRGNNVNFSATLTPSRQYGQTMSISYEHSGSIDNFRCNADASYGSQRYSSALEARNSDSRKSVSVQIETPHQGYRQLSGQLEYSKSSSEVTASVVLSAERRSMNANLEYTMQGQQKTGSVRVSAPFMDDVEISFRHNGQIQNFENSMEISVMRQAFTSSVALDMLSAQKSASISVTTPYAGYRVLSAETSYEGVPRNFQARSSFTLNRDTVSTEVAIDFASSRKQVTATVTTPDNERMSCNLQFQGRATHFNTEGTIEVFRQRYNAIAAIDLESPRKTGSINVETPIPGYESLSGTFEHVGSSGTCNTEITISKNRQTLRSVTNIDLNSAEKRVSYSLQTPFENFESSSIEITYRGISFSNFRNNVQLHIMNQRFTSEIVYDILGRSKNVALTVTTPYPRFETSAIRLSVEGDSNQFESTIQTSFMRKDVELVTSLNLANPEKSVSITMTTPFAGYERLSTEATYRGSWTSHRSQITLRKNQYSIATECQVSFDGDVKSASLGLQTPSENYGLEFSHSGQWDNLRNEIAVTVGPRRYAWEATLVEERGEWTATAILTTPHTAISRIAVQYVHSAKKMNYRDVLTLQINDDTYSANTLFRYNPKSGVLRMNAEVNIDNKAYGINIQHRGDWTDMEDSFVILTGTEKVQGNSQISIGDSGMSATASVSTPYRGYRNMNANLNHNGGLGEFSSSGSLSIPAVSYDVSVSRTRRGLSSRGTVSLPFQSLPSVGYEIQHTGENGNFETSVSGEANGRRVSGSLNYNNNGRGFSSRGALNIPGWDTVSYSINHNGNAQQFRTIVEVQTPMRSLPVCTVTLSHRGSISNFEEQLTVEYNNKRLESAITYRKEESGSRFGYGTTNVAHIADISLDTPYSQWNGDSHVELRKTGTTYSAALQLTQSRRQIFDAEYSLDYGNIKSLSVEMRRPVPYTATLRYQDEGAVKTVDVNVNNQGDRATANVVLKNEDELKGIMIDFKKPEYRFFLGTNYTLTASRFAHVLDLNNLYISQIEGTLEQRGYRKIIDGRASLDIPRTSMEVSMTHETRENSYVSSVTFGRTRPVTVRHEYSSSGDEFTSDLRISHPALSNDGSLQTRGTIRLQSPVVLDGSIVAVVENERVEFVGRIADESRYSRKRWVANAHLTHPATYTDAQLTSSLENNDETLALNMQTSYKMTRDRQTRIMQMRAAINKLRSEIDVAVATPLVNTELNGRIAQFDATQGILRAECSGTYNGKSVRGEMNLDKRVPSVELQIVSDDLTARCFGGYENDDYINLECFHARAGERVQDAQMKLRLMDTRVLETRFYMRPQTLSYFKSLYTSDYRQPSLLTAAVSAMTDDLVYKGRYANRAFADVIQAAQQINQDIQQRIAIVSNVLTREYYADRFYIRTMTESTQQIYQSIIHKIEMAKQKIAHDVAQLKEYLRQLYHRMCDSASRMGQETSRKMSELSYSTKGHLSRAGEYINDVYYTHAHPRVVRMGEYVNSVYETTTQPIRNNERVRRVISIASDHYINPAVEFFNSIRTWYNEMVLMIRDYWTQIEATPQYQQVKQTITRWVEHTQWWYDYLEIEQLIMAKLEELRGYTLQNLIARAGQAIKEVSGFNRSRFTVYNPNGGEIAAEIYLPFEMENLKTMPDLNIAGKIATIQRYIRTYVPDMSDFCIWDTYYAYKPPSDINEYVPPFKAHATLAGAQSYITFDHRFYEFSGECSYLLARDFIDGRFSVVVNYDNVQGQKTKKSITVMSGEHEIEIYSDSKVMLDNRRTELPIDVPQTSVVRDGNFVKVINEHGLMISCNLPYDTCQIEVSGWYYGRTAGMLGTYDNEPSTDYIMADRRTASTPEELANSWTVGRRCNIRNNAHIDQYPSEQRQRACDKYFQDTSSPFRPGFRIVSPSSAMKMCIDRPASRSNSLDDERDVCQAASYYVRECQMHDVHLEMPADCVKCELNDGRSFTKDQTITIAEGSDYPVPQSADVVFAVSHGECNREVTERIRNIANLLERGLQRDGIRNNRYALVGFGGEGNHFSAHTHTMSGSVFNDKDNLISAVENNFEIVAEDQHEDAMQAIDFASKLSFRPGVSKTVILIPCDSCHDATTSYSTLQKTLKKDDVRLHVVMDHEFTIRTRSVKTSYIFGVDRDSLYNVKHVRQNPLVGESEMRPHVVMPKDICAALAEESDGSVFNVAKMTESRPFIQKKFIDVMTRLVVKKAEPTECQVCQCVEDEAGVGKSECQRCDALDGNNLLMTNLQDMMDNDSTEEDFERDLNRYINTNEPVKNYSSKKYRTKYSKQQ